MSKSTHTYEHMKNNMQYLECTSTLSELKGLHKEKEWWNYYLYSKFLSYTFPSKFIQLIASGSQFGLSKEREERNRI